MTTKPTSERDPRRDPEPGDVVTDESGKKRRKVVRVFEDEETTRVTYGPMTALPMPPGTWWQHGLPRTCSLATWRRWARNGAVWDTEAP